MSTSGYKRVIFVLALLLVGALVCTFEVGENLSKERGDVRGVWSAVRDFERTRDNLAKMSIDDDIAYVDIFAHANSLGKDALGRIAAYEKDRIIKDLINDLRKKTGQDLGEDPEKWVQRFGRENGKPATH